MTTPEEHLCAQLASALHSLPFDRDAWVTKLDKLYQRMLGQSLASTNLPNHPAYVALHRAFAEYAKLRYRDYTSPWCASSATAAPSTAARKAARTHAGKPTSRGASDVAIRRSAPGRPYLILREGRSGRLPNRVGDPDRVEVPGRLVPATACCGHAQKRSTCVGTVPTAALQTCREYARKRPSETRSTRELRRIRLAQRLLHVGKTGGSFQ
jgi:hypothetical protein